VDGVGWASKCTVQSIADHQQGVAQSESWNVAEQAAQPPVAQKVLQLEQLECSTCSWTTSFSAEALDLIILQCQSLSQLCVLLIK